MTVELSEQSARFIDEQVRSGRFATPAAAIDAALSRLQAQSDEELAGLRALVAVGTAEADRCEFVDFTAADVIAECRAEFPRRRGQA